MSIPALKTQVRWSVLVGWILFWILMVAIEVQDFRRSGGSAFWQPILWQLSSACVITGLLWLQRPMLLNPTSLKTPRLWFGRILLLHPLVCVVFIVLVFAIRHVVYRLMGDVYSHEAWNLVFLYETIKLSLFLSLFYVIFFGVQSYSSLIDERENAAQAMKLFQQAQLQRLTQQMQPHFLFNALNTISSLMYSDLNAADTAISRLAELLRHTLDLGEQTETSVEREIALLRAYAELMQLRFVDRVNITWDIAPDSLVCKVPTMCLQVLLENTFKHTVEKRSGMTQVSIRAQKIGDQLQLSVEDDVGQLGENPNGIGLQNLRQRLTTMYGNRATLRVEAKTHSGVRSVITIVQNP